ncbi:MAG: hypothetical protein JWO98_5385 [Frankiales bacterium]|nr:hypothetical protein [Frankiales bacterium]
MDNPEIRETLALVRQLQVLAKEVEGRLSQALDENPAAPALDTREAMRVERFGEVAHRHMLAIEQNGEMTLGESLAIRREMFGDKVQSTANLFGTKDSGALFYRKTPYGKTRNDSDKIALTEEGERIARLWRELHTGDAA